MGLQDLWCLSLAIRNAWDGISYFRVHLRLILLGITMLTIPKKLGYGAIWCPITLYYSHIYIYIYLSTENWNCTSKYGSPRTKGTEVTEEEGTHRIILGNKQYWILPSSSSSLLNRPDVSWMDKHRPPPILPLMLQSFLASTGFLFFFMRVNIIQDIYVHSKTLGL